MVFAGSCPLPNNAVEIFGVFADQCSTLGGSVSEELFVGQLSQVWIIGSGDDVVAALTKPRGGDAGMVHVEDELHPARRPSRRRHVASSSSAAATLSAISLSISVVNSA